jgi:aspartate kinase
MDRSKHVEGFVIRNIELNRTEGRIMLTAVRDRPGICARIFQELADQAINVNLIVQTSRPDGSAYVTFTVPRDRLADARRCCEGIRGEIGVSGIDAEPHTATVSVVGVGMRSHTDVARRTFAALAKANVNIDMISTSEIEIECVIRDDQAQAAHQALLEEFRSEIA